MKSLVVTLLTLITIPVYSQTTSPGSLRDLIAGKTGTLILRAKDLNENYVILRCSGPPKSEVETLMMQSSPGGFNTLPSSAYFTRGETMQLESGTYLLAYTVAEDERTSATPGVDYEEYDEQGMPLRKLNQKLRPRDKLLLCLLDLNKLGHLTSLTPFEAETHLESEAERNRAVAQTLQILGQAIEQYLYTQPAPDGIPRFPRWTNIATSELRQRLHSHVAMPLWEHPSTEEAFGLNPALSNQNLYQLTNARWLYMAYERTAGADGTRAVLFADGRVERVAPDRWERLLKAAPESLKPSAPIVTETPIVAQKQVVLTGAAALYYMYKKQRDTNNRPIKTPYYLSKNGRLYYRDAQTKQAIYATPPTQGFRVPANEAKAYEALQGYDGSATGRDLAGLVPAQ